MLIESYPEILRSAVYTNVTEKRQYRKICAKWVPKLLPDHHKTLRMGAALTFLQCYQDEEVFLDKIIIEDETWVLYEMEETKKQLKQWVHSYSPRPKKFKQTFSSRK